VQKTAQTQIDDIYNKN